MGADFAPVVFALFEWGATHLSGSGLPPFDFEHRRAAGDEDCGAAVHARVVCDAGHELDPHEVVVRRASRRRR